MEIDRKAGKVAREANCEIARIRKEIGLSSTQLAHRLGKTQSSTLRLESSEKRGAITLASLKNAAEKLGCKLVYEFVPIDSAPMPTKQASIGLKRMQPAPKKGQRSKVSESMREEVHAIAMKLSPEERIERCCALSDLTREIRTCSKKHS